MKSIGSGLCYAVDIVTITIPLFRCQNLCPSVPFHQLWSPDESITPHNIRIFKQQQQHSMNAPAALQDMDCNLCTPGIRNARVHASPRYKSHVRAVVQSMYGLTTMSVRQNDVSV